MTNKMYSKALNLFYFIVGLTAELKLALRFVASYRNIFEA